MRHRTRATDSPLAGSESELTRMTAELDEVHHDQSLPALRRAVARLAEEARDDREADGGPRRTSRRTFLLGTGALAAGGALLAACGSASPSASAGRDAVARGAYPADLTGDLEVAALAASLENLGVYAYTAGIHAARAGKLGTVPQAVLTFATTARSQHQQHAAAWNAVLAGAGKAKVTENDPALASTVRHQLATVTDVTGLAKLALSIEDIAAQTYQVGTTELRSSRAVATAATIQPVELQHAAILRFVLGEYPVPYAFNPTSDARSASDLRA